MHGLIRSEHDGSTMDQLRIRPIRSVKNPLFYGLNRAAVICTERSGFFQIVTERSGADIRSSKYHGFWRSGLSVLICCHGLERISRECHGADRSRYPLVEKVTDYHGADIRPLEMSRIGADWAISSVIIRIMDYISIRTHPWYFSCPSPPSA